MIVSLSSYAQEVFPYRQLTYYVSQPKQYKSTLLNQKVSSYTIQTTLLKKKKSESKIEYTLNKLGYSTDYSWFNPKNKLLVSWHFQYLNDSLSTLFYRTNKKGDTTVKTLYSYNDDGKLIRKDNFFRTMKAPKNYEIRTYSNKNEWIKDDYYKNNGKLVYRYEYDYYENGNKKETRYFNGKNKLKFKYTYACDPKGELENKEVKERNYCTKKNLNADGSFFEIFEYKDEKNRIRKTIYSYLKDSTLYQYENFNFRGKSTSRANYVYDKSNHVKYYYYFNGKGKQLYAYEYKYNEKGLMEKYISLNKKGNPEKETTYTYNYRE